jgi:hypothetical protein
VFSNQFNRFPSGTTGPSSSQARSLTTFVPIRPEFGPFRVTDSRAFEAFPNVALAIQLSLGDVPGERHDGADIWVLRVKSMS